jgi:hypothetical protein
MRPTARAAAWGALLALVLHAVPASPAACQQQQAVVRGFVTAATTGQPVGDALVILVARQGAGQVQVRTDSTGAFRLVVATSGVYTFTVLSDEPPGAESRPVVLGHGEELVLHVRLGAAVFELEPISVIASADVVTERVRTFRERATFNRSLGRGRVFLREDVEALQPRSAAALLGTVHTSRCEPTLKLDGLPTTVADLRTVPAGALEGMEVYMGVDVPREFEERGSCGVVLVWTRGKPEGMRDMSPLYILVSGLLSAATFLLMR